MARSATGSPMPAQRSRSSVALSERGAARAKAASRRPAEPRWRSRSTRPIRTRSRSAVREIEANPRPVDILVNAPGVNSSTPFFDIDLDEWHRLLDANLTSVFVACQVFGRAMVDARSGRVDHQHLVRVVGPAAERVLTYSVAKAGLNNLTQYLAAELAPHRDPRQRESPRASFPRSRTARSCPRTACGRSSATRPAGRLGEPHELVGAVVWLASEQASSFVTGAIVRVDGGFSAMTI